MSDFPEVTMTPRQQRRIAIEARKDELRAALGITDFSNFGRLSDGKALEALATEDATVQQLASAVHWLDRDGGSDLAEYSHAAATTDATRRIACGNVRKAMRLEGEALDHMLEGSPRAVVRRLLVQRLRQAGVTLPNDHLHCCRELFLAFQTRRGILPHLRNRPDLRGYIDRADQTLASYGVKA